MFRRKQGERRVIAFGFNAAGVNVHLVNGKWLTRLARDSDIPVLEKLIPISVRGLSEAAYSGPQMDAAIGSVFGVDRQLIRDGTYYVVEEKSEIIACGGWSKRKTLFGGDHHTSRDDAELDCTREPARIRAFFVHPDWARHGLGRAILDESERAIRAAGFLAIELAATLPGVSFYEASGYLSGERSDVPLPNGLSLGIVRMTKKLEGRAPSRR